jgi:hypothetical protein
MSEMNHLAVTAGASEWNRTARRRVGLVLLVVGFAFLAAGCSQTKPGRVVGPVPISQYHAGDFHWSSVRRVVILPLWNESPDPTAAQAIREALAAELQSIGRFEVLLAPSETPPEWSRSVRLSGRFDEMELVELAQAFHADTVLCGAVTYYDAYAPPRIGLSLRLISSAESIVIASVDGLWDARDLAVADEARSYYAQTMTMSQATAGQDAILTSPRLFQKYVCAQVSRVMCCAGGISAPVTEILPASKEPALQ